MQRRFTEIVHNSYEYQALIGGGFLAVVMSHNIERYGVKLETVFIKSLT